MPLRKSRDLAPERMKRLRQSRNDAQLSGGVNNVWCYKEQYCIGTWNVRFMNHGKLDTAKQGMAKMNNDILAISELKWTGKGKFNSDGPRLQNEAGQRLTVLPREWAGHSKHPPPTTQEMTQHMDITRWSILNQNDLFFAAKDEETIQSAKIRPGIDYGSDNQLRLKLK